jgi:hypothetical protein
MSLDNIDMNEYVVINIEQVKDIDNWREFLNELTEEGTTMVTILEEKSLENNEYLGCYNIEIVCFAGVFIENIEKFSELDEYGMLSVRKTYNELEDLYYED